MLCAWAQPLPPPTSSWSRNAIGKCWTQNHAENLVKVAPQFVAPICWNIPPDGGGGGLVVYIQRAEPQGNRPLLLRGGAPHETFFRPPHYMAYQETMMGSSHFFHLVC